jgi:hypothetical protein
MYFDMKRIFRVFYLIVAITIFCGCGGGSWDVYLCVQKIQGCSKVIYKYDAWGGRDSNKSGYAILDSSETFDVNKINELPISYLEEVPNKNYITAIEQSLPDSAKNSVFLPIKIYSTNEQGIDIKIKKYQYKGFSEIRGGYGDYQFTSFKETKDSLFFYGLDDVKSMEHLHFDSLKLKKANVVIAQSKSKEILAIDIEDLKISKNNRINSIVTYSLKRKHTITSNSFSDYGIFKQKL